MNFRKLFIYIFMCCCCHWVLKAQTIKQIEVAGNEPYVDHVSLIPGDRDMDLLIKIAFDESNNSLTVSLISYRKLFVFQRDVRYSQVVRCFKLRPGKLPYVVESDEQARYKLTKPLRKSIKPKRKHIFKQWISYEGLQPQPSDYKMVNDYIEQSFDILHRNNFVTVSLRDIIVMDEQSFSKKKKYDLFFQTDLNRTYEIILKRDPCFGKEEVLQIATKRLENIQSGFAEFKKVFARLSGSHIAGNEKVYSDMKSLLLAQFPKVEDTDLCPAVQANIELYNSYVDSIQGMVLPVVSKIQRQEKALELSADYILTMAKRIDSSVSRWVISSDSVEKRDLETLCREIIQQIQSSVDQSTYMNESQRAAIRIFNSAQNYFYKICKNDEE